MKNFSGFLIINSNICHGQFDKSSVSSVNAKCCRYWDICGAQRNQNVTDNTCKKKRKTQTCLITQHSQYPFIPPTQRYFQPKLAPTLLSLLLGWGTIDTILKEIKYDFDVLQSYKFLQCRPVRPAQQSWEGLRGSKAIKRMVQTSETKGRNFHSDRMLLIFLFSLLIQQSTATNSIFSSPADQYINLKDTSGSLLRRGKACSNIFVWYREQVQGKSLKVYNSLHNMM